MMQTHYRSTLDFSNEALQASEKGFERLMNAMRTLGKIIPSGTSTSDIRSLQEKCFAAMNDDFNSPVLIAHLFEGVRIINSVNDRKESISKSDLELLRDIFHDFVSKVLGLKEEVSSANNDQLAGNLMNLILEIRNEAKSKKDFPTSDKIRDGLASSGIVVKDTKYGTTWEKEK